jgi:hypothetical protein
MEIRSRNFHPWHLYLGQIDVEHSSGKMFVLDEGEEGLL